MTLVFENPNGWLLAAAAVPLLVHLLARSRPRETAFSSLLFLRELMRRYARRRQPKDWLLLLLRTLLCAALAAAFLLPVLTREVGGQGGRALVLVLDNTASMGAADGQQLRMARALAAAEGAVRELGADDAVNLVTLAGYPRFLFDRPEAAREMVLRELARTRSVPAASSGVQEALRAAVEQIRHLPEGVKGELMVISDFQRRGWESVDFDAVLPRDIPVRFVNVAQAQQVENSFIAGLSLHPAHPLPGQEVTATVLVQSSVPPSAESRGAEVSHGSQVAKGSDGVQGAQDAPRSEAAQGGGSMSVTLAAGDLRLTQPCTLRADGSGEVQFRLEAPSAGSQWVLQARTEGDAFPEDNVRRLAVPLADHLDCLVIAPERSQGGFLLRALEKVPFLRTLQLPALSQQRADVIVWTAPEAGDAEEIRRCLDEGATVLLAPDLREDGALSAVLAGHGGRFRGETRSGGKGWRLRLSAPGDRVFELFRGIPMEALWDCEHYARLEGSWEDLLPPGSTVLLRYEDGVPALARVARGRGCLLIWNMAVTGRDNRMGYSPLFLPLLAESLLRSREDQAPPEPVAGLDVLEFEAPAREEVADLSLRNEAGEELEVQEAPLRPGRPRVLRSTQPALPGLYRWMRGETTLAQTAVNFPSEESELRLMDLRRLPQQPVSADEEAEAGALASDLPNRVELWPWLLVLALLCWLTELLLCRSPKSPRLS